MTLFSRARQSTHRLRRDEDGYVLLTLLLVVALMAIAAAAVLPTISFEIRRDREQEMIHRGVQYSRAIRAYYKKFGRYPTRLEDLESTNNLRFLRKRYKDPLNCPNSKCQDFKLLHFGEPGVTLGGGGLSLPGGSIPGATPVGSPAGINGPGSNNSGFGGPAFGSSGSGVNSSGVFAQSSGLGGNTNSGNANGGFGANSNSQTSSGQPGTPGSDPTQASSQVAAGTAQGDTSSSSQQVIGGPIVGVASVIKKPTIREFNKKKKYNEWQFVYDPTNEPRGGLITTPNQPLLQGFGTQPGQNVQPGSNNSSPFGQPTGFGNNPNSSGSASPAQPSTNPPQPQ